MTTAEFINLWIQEDEGSGDYSSLAIIGPGQKSKAILMAKEDGIIAGVELASLIYQTACKGKFNFVALKQDGESVYKGDSVFEIECLTHDLLRMERIVLNCMQRMSGIATLTNKFCSAVKETNAIILDTRKTTPLFRYFEKWAVRIGGGQNHRMGLYDMIMLKDNHIDFAGGISAAIKKTQNYLNSLNKTLNIEIETRNLQEVEEVISTGGVNRIMFDNFSITDIKTAVKLINNKFETEASGNITLETVSEYALTGVDFISAGCLTHSYKSLDLSLKAV